MLHAVVSCDIGARKASPCGSKELPAKVVDAGAVAAMRAMISG